MIDFDELLKVLAGVVIGIIVLVFFVVAFRFMEYEMFCEGPAGRSNSHSVCK